jgi:DNA recombination-dependent growth factor C
MLGAFNVGSNCELVDMSDQSIKGRLIGHDLLCSDVVQEMISDGMQVKTLQMHMPDMVTFAYGQAHVIKSMRWADELIAEAADSDEESALARHAADLAIQIPTVRDLIEKLGAAFSGWEMQTTADV